MNKSQLPLNHHFASWSNSLYVASIPQKPHSNSTCDKTYGEDIELTCNSIQSKLVELRWSFLSTEPLKALLEVVGSKLGKIKLKQTRTWSP